MRMLILAMLLAGSVSAEERAAYTWGAGGSSCGEWTEGRKGSNWHDEAQWILGYLTADSYYRYLAEWPEAEAPDAVAIVTWMDNYCSENPLDLVRDAVRELVAELTRRKAE